MIAALFVQRNGCYYGLPDVDPWDEARDARLYDGPYPVVAHPPCARWCRLAGLVEARYGYKRGEDGGCFASALDSVRRFGGVLEHPAYSDAWEAFGLPRPDRKGGWWGDESTGYSCYVEQGRYGHPARKGTWLYAFGCELPGLLWGYGFRSNVWVSGCQNHNAGRVKRRLSKKAASATPLAFRDVLIGMARSVR